MADILLGVIIGAHGIRGHVKIKSFTEDPMAIALYGTLVTPDGRSFDISKAKPTTEDVLIATLSGVTDRTAAEALKGLELRVARDHLPPTAEGEYYLGDLVGRKAFANGVELGPVIGIQNYGAGDLIEIQPPKKGATLLVPTAFVATSQPDVILDLPEGFLDLKAKREAEEDLS
jgi:16S rRNA processing protein RimM